VIPTIKEPSWQFKEFRLYEDCYFCNNPTDMWHLNTNAPVCPKCSKIHDVADLDNYMVETNKKFRERKPVKMRHVTDPYGREYCIPIIDDGSESDDACVLRPIVQLDD
jgi:hypothetical protein